MVARGARLRNTCAFLKQRPTSTIHARRDALHGQAGIQGYVTFLGLSRLVNDRVLRVL